MKALVFHQPGEINRVLHLEEIDTPLPSETQVLIEVKARPVNPSDAFFIAGNYRRKPAYPQVAGLEGAGIVKACGSQVTKLKPGDRIFLRTPGTWAEQIVVDQHVPVKFTGRLSFETACQVGLNGITAEALLSECHLQSGDVLLIDAASSSLAGLIIQLARARGIEVIALVRRADTVEAVAHSGAATVLMQDDPSIAEELLRRLGTRTIKAFIDAVGGNILTAVIPVMAAMGTIIIMGNMSKGAPAQFTNPQIIYRHLTIKGFGIDQWLSSQPREHIAELYQNLLSSLEAGTLHFRRARTQKLGDPFTINGSEKVILVSD